MRASASREAIVNGVDGTARVRGMRRAENAQHPRSFDNRLQLYNRGVKSGSGCPVPVFSLLDFGALAKRQVAPIK